MAHRVNGSRSSSGPGEWTFLTNHAHVLLCIAKDADVRLRDVADSVGITERATQRLATLAEPVMIVVFGLIVAFVAMSLLQAIYGINAGSFR